MLIKIKSFSRRVANLIEFVVGIFDIGVRPIYDKNKTKGVLGIVKLDAIGDYILFRNFLPFITRSKKYSGCEIIFIGNKIYKDFAEQMDGHLIKKFIWVDIGLLWKNSKYRNMQINLINKVHFDCIFHPTYSRRYYVDKFIKQINSNEKIGVRGDNKNTISILNKISEIYYTRLIKIKDPRFEFFRNKLIVNEFLGEELNVLRPSIEIEKKEKRPKTILIFPEASVSYKVWPEKKFAGIINFFGAQKKYSIIIGGIDREKSERISELCNKIDIINMVGRTNLYELAQLISSVELLISNDTVAVHLAAAVNTPSLCIFNGKNYGCFVPYPIEVYDKLKTVSPKHGHNIKSISTQNVINIVLDFIN